MAASGVTAQATAAARTVGHAAAGAVASQSRSARPPTRAAAARGPQGAALGLIRKVMHLCVKRVCER